VKKLIIKERKKYELEPEIIDDYIKRIRLHMETVKPYLDPNFVISMLSDAVSIPVYHISKTINNRFQKNFNEFINSYRVDEAKRKLSEPGQCQATILDIAYKVGFNSKSTFNNAFKKITNMTPTQYKKAHCGTENIPKKTEKEK
jgi:AraC-like DNA-binding protein